MHDVHAAQRRQKSPFTVFLYVLDDKKPALGGLS